VADNMVGRHLIPEEKAKAQLLNEKLSKRAYVKNSKNSGNTLLLY